MEKTKKTKEVQLTFTKIELDSNEDWGGPSMANRPMGLYLGETLTSGAWVCEIDEYGGRAGFWLPMGEVVKQKVKEQQDDIVTSLSAIDQRLKTIEKATYDSNVVINDMMAGGDIEDKFAEINLGVDSLRKGIEQLYQNIGNFQNSIGNHKSSLTEMGDVVVSVLKATK